MGRSEWQLAFAGPTKKVRKMEKFINSIMHSKKRSLEERNAASVILGCKVCVAENKLESQRGVAYRQGNMKCNKTWAKFIEELIIYARTKLKIKASYARIGDSMDDYEFNDEEDLRLHYTRSLQEVDF